LADDIDPIGSLMQSTPSIQGRFLTRVPFALLAADRVHLASVEIGDREVEIIVYLHAGIVIAFLNRCPHWRVPLNSVTAGSILDAGELHCDSHGATFDPGSGLCTSGPCEGQSLKRLIVEDGPGYVSIFEPARLTGSYAIVDGRES
jgi:nitrite reductase/ring-hydroxylating ferredoxin subunit